MSENIGLKITLNGVSEVVTDVNKLKSSIDGAKKTLEGLEEGSFAFEQLTEEINLADAALKGFEETASDMKAPQKMGLLKQAGELVGSAFSAANQTLKVFGIDTEKIGNTARRVFQSIKKPLDEMTSSLEKTGEELKEIPGPIGQFAQGISGVAKAMKILLANPIIAFLAAIVGALTLLYKAFTSTKAGAEQMERIFAGLGAVVDVLRDRFLKFSSAIGKLFTLDLKGAVEDFRGSLSGIGQEIVSEAQEAARLKGILQDITDSTRNLNKERARQNVLIADAKLKINDENLSLADRLKALEQIRKSEISLADQEAELAKRRFETIQRQNQLSDSNKEALDQEAEAFIQYQQKILDSKTKQKELFDQEKALRDRQRSEQKAANDARVAELVNESNLLLEQLKIENERLGVISKLNPLQAEVIDQLTKQISEVEKFTSVRERFLTFEDKYLKVLGQLVPQQDKLGQLFDKSQETAEGYFDQLSKGEMSIIDVVTGLQNYRKTQLEINKDILSPTQQDLFTKYIDGYEKVFITLDQFRQAKVQPPFDLKEYEKLVVDLALLNEQITIDPFSGRTPEQRAEALLNVQKLKDEVEQDFLRAFKDLNKDVLKGLKGDALVEQTKKLEEQGKVVFRQLIDSGAEIVKFEEGVGKVGLKVLELNNKLKELSETAKAGFLIENIEDFTKTFDVDLNAVSRNRKDLETLENEINTKRFDTQRKFAVDILDLETQLKEQGVDISKFTYEEQLLILQGFLKKEVEEVEKAEDKKKKKRQDTLQDIKFGIQEFQSVLNSINQLTNDYYEFQFDQLASRNEEIQSKIIGDTKEAQQKRLESEQIYQEKVKQLQKQQAITQLRIALLQSTANVAEAITRAFTAGPVIGQIAAGIIAGVGIAQTALIGKQLSQLQSLQRGGMIRRGQGGLVVGPSHEYGGVKYQGGGIELEGGESVINRVSSVRYNDLLNQINVSGGGKPLVTNNFDDSRIVEAISRQRSEPIRAYVLESEITKTQGINRRLEQLSSL